MCEATQESDQVLGTDRKIQSDHDQPCRQLDSASAELALQFYLNPALRQPEGDAQLLMDAQSHLAFANT